MYFEIPTVLGIEFECLDKPDHVRFPKNILERDVETVVVEMLFRENRLHIGALDPFIRPRSV